MLHEEAKAGITMFADVLVHAEGYSMLKRELGETLGASADLLHLHLGLVIFVVTALLLRRRMRSVWPLAIVAAFALINEMIDYAVNEPWSATRSAVDVVNTLFWPMVLFLLARRSVRPVRRCKVKERPFGCVKFGQMTQGCRQLAEQKKHCESFSE